MSFGDCSFAGGHVGITQEMCLKYTRNITKQPPGMSQRGRRPTSRQIRAQPVEKEDETQTKLSPSGINFHRTNQEAYWRTPIETGLIQAQSWCGRTTGAAAPHWTVWPKPLPTAIYRLSNVSCRGLVQVQCTRRSVCSLMREKEYSRDKTTSSTPIKGGLPLTQQQHT